MPSRKAGEYTKLERPTVIVDRQKFPKHEIFTVTVIHVLILLGKFYG